MTWSWMSSGEGGGGKLAVEAGRERPKVEALASLRRRFVRREASFCCAASADV